MRLALRELRRTPGRFFVATVTISLIAILLMFLGALLDGLLQLSTGGYQAQRGQLVVMGDDAKGVLSSSRLTTDDRSTIEAEVATVTDAAITVNSFGESTLGARLDGGDDRELTSVRLRGFELAPVGFEAAVPADGEVWADPDLAGSFAAGDILLLGPNRAEVEIIGFLDKSDTPSLGGIWGSAGTWRTVLASSRPDLQVSDNFTQAFIVDLGEGADSDTITAAVTAINDSDAAFEAFTIEEASNAIPGVDAQRVTFNQIIAITTVIAVVVIALFFALLTAERAGLYGVLKAVGARSSTLFVGLLTQALVITIIAATAGLAMMAAAYFGIPPGSLPFAITWTRLLGSVGLLLLAAIIGSAFSLRTVLRIDPAEAIGGN